MLSLAGLATTRRALSTISLSLSTILSLYPSLSITCLLLSFSFSLSLDLDLKLHFSQLNQKDLTMSKPWGGPGAWAMDAERAEAEERDRQTMAGMDITAQSQSFPSLKEATSTKAKKKKMSLAEFNSQDYQTTDRLTTDEIFRLPTGPKERAPEELESARGFRSYGLRSGPPSRRADDSGTQWGSSARRTYNGGFDDERGPPPRREFDQPSRADEVDNWASAKSSTPILQAETRRYARDRYTSLGGGGISRADEVDNWAAAKKTLPYTRPAMERDKPRIVLDRPASVALDKPVADVEQPRAPRPSPFGAARPREEILAEKGLDWKKLDLETDTRKLSRPTSSQSSRPSSAHSSRPQSPAATNVPVLALRPKVNPFGDAKPREVLLAERGMDWRKIDFELEHKSVDRVETETEKMLKAEIDYLKTEVAKISQATANGNTSLHLDLQQKERELELLVRELDDKVRFGQRAIERPGSGGGRDGYGYLDRPSSHSSRSEDSRNIEFLERPLSRESRGDVWSRNGDDRRTNLPIRGGFFSNRDFDRSKSRERW